jgi:hypothetical protein
MISSPRAIIFRLIFFYVAVEDHQLGRRTGAVGDRSRLISEVLADFVFLQFRESCDL